MIVTLEQTSALPRTCFMALGKSFGLSNPRLSSVNEKNKLIAMWLQRLSKKTCR